MEQLDCGHGTPGLKITGMECYNPTICIKEKDWSQPVSINSVQQYNKLKKSMVQRVERKWVEISETL